jgi:uncharacterized SAM-binding protein YcdF (DUF218 family)
VTFYLKKLIEIIFLPPLMPLLVVACGLFLIGRKQQKGLIVAWTGLIISIVFTTPLTVGFMTRHLESIPPVNASQLKNGQAIVILGGGQRGMADEYGCYMPNRFTLERVFYGAFLARRTQLPVLVSGGAVLGEKPEAEIMADTLVGHFSIPVKWVENKSRDTVENARYSAEILKSAGIHTVVLITHASHMRRAVYEFTRMGLEVIPAPTAFFSTELHLKPVSSLIPDMTSISIGFYVVHEWVGILAQHIRDIMT